MIGAIIYYMGKKVAQEEAPRRASTRAIKKKHRSSEEGEEVFNEDESQEDSGSRENNSDEQYSDSADNQNDEEGQSSSEIPQIAPENLAVRNMQFRERRGTKMNYLINRKKEEEEDPFWAQQGQNYFGDLDDGDNDQEDYVQSSSGRDEFDSDFDQTESEHEQQEEEEEKEVDQDKEKTKKKRQELMRKIHAPAPQIKKSAVSAVAKKPEKSDSQKKVVLPETASRYIHQVFNQQQLLGEAATTEYFNWLSLKKLISIETEKKDFTKRQHHIEGPKVIYRDRLNNQGKREQTYQLQNVEAKGLGDLYRIMHQH